jgi:hypothetical protein
MRGAERHSDLLTAKPVDDRKASWDWWIGPLALEGAEAFDKRQWSR